MADIQEQQENNASTVDTLRTKLAVIFQRAQTSVAWKKQCVQDVLNMQQEAIKELQDPVNEFEGTTFYKAFMGHVYSLLKILTRSPAIERCIKFVYESVLQWDSKNDKVQTEDGEESLPIPFASTFLSNLLNLSRSKSPAVRFRVCQLVSFIINGMQEDADIDDLWDPIVETMLSRTKDSNVSCRVFAITSLKRLHEPDEKKDKVTIEFKYLMRCDTSDRVRMAALNNVGISRVTLNDVLLCLRDKDYKVRVKAFDVINECVAINNLTLDQRMDVLAAGFEDRNAKVFKACQKLVTKSWYRQRNYNPEKLLQALDIESSERGEKIGEYVVQSLILAAFNKANPTNAEEFMDETGKIKTREYEVYQADLSPESVLFWRGQCEMFQGTAELSKDLNISDDLRETKLESLIGPLVEFCERIEKVWNNSCANQNDIDKEEQEEADVADMLGDLSIDDSSDEDGDDDGNSKRRTVGGAGPRQSTLSDRTDKEEQDRADFAIAQEFVCRQLLICARSFDFADEMGRQQLITLLSQMLQAVETPMSVIDAATETFIAAHAEGFESTLGLVTIISDVTVGINDEDNNALTDEARAEKEAQVNMLKELMEEKRNEKEICKKNDDFVNAQKLKEEIEAASMEIVKLEEELERETGEWKWIRSFAIARVLLSQVKTTIQQDQYIAPLIHTLIEPAMAQQHLNGHPAIREGYVKCLASYCLLDPTGEMTKSYLNAFVSFAEKDPEVHVRIAAIKGLADLLLIFKGKFLAQEDVQEGDNLTKETIEKSIRIMLNYASEDIASTLTNGKNESDEYDYDEEVDGLRQLRIVCVDALTRLTFLRRCTNIKVMRELILLAYASDTESYPEIRQCLVIFLPLFAKSGKCNRLMIEQATMDVMEEVMYPSSMGKYGKTKPDAIGKFLLFLMSDAASSTGFNDGEFQSSIHGRVGVQMILRILADPNVMDGPIISLTRALSKVSVPTNDVVNAYIIRKNIDVLNSNEHFKCKTTKKMLDSFTKKLDEVLANITNESMQDACNKAMKAFEASLESERLVCVENYQQREALKAKGMIPRKSGKKTATKKRPTTIKKKRRLKRGGGSKMTLLTNENVSALSNSSDKRRTSASRKSWRSSNGSLVSAIQNLDLSLGSITGRPSVVRKAQAMNEIDNLLSSDED
jgi:hypothetical protein